MSIVKSIDVGDGDMFYIKHNNGCFTTIDCCMNYDNKEYIMDEIEKESRESSITRFISTHPDDDHFRNIEYCKSQYKYVQKVENKNVQLLHSVIALTFKKSLFVFKPI